MLFTNCTEVLILDIKNGRNEVIQVSIISTEFKLIQDTIWSETDSMFALSQRIDSHPFSRSPYYSCNVRGVDDKRSIKNLSSLGEKQCFSFIEEVNNGKTIKVSFRILPNESLNLVSYPTPFASLDQYSVSAVDTLIIDNLNSAGTLKLELNGFEAIKNLITDPENCKTCILSIN